MNTSIQRKKIAYVIDTLRLGGAERMLVSLALALPRDEYEVHVYTIVDAGELSTKLEQAGIPVKNIGKHGKISLLTLVRLRAAFKEFQPDLVHTHLFAADVYGHLVAWWLGIPAITTEHNINLDQRGIKQRIRTCWSRYSQVVVAVSQAVKAYSISDEHVALEKIQVIYNGIDTVFFSPRAATYATNGLVTIGMTSRLHANKGHVYALEAVAQLRQENVHVLIAGDGPERERIMQKIIDLGLQNKVELVGAVTDVREVLARMDVVVLPTIQEGFGLSVAEAMSMEKPVVVFNTGPMKELVIDGVTGFVVAPRDVGMLRERLLTLINDPALRLKMGQAGRARVEEKFSLHTMVDQYIRLYQGV